MLVWLAGGLLALVSTGRWREVPVGEAPVLLVRLLVHPSAPVGPGPVPCGGAFLHRCSTDALLVFVGLLGLLAASGVAHGGCAPEFRGPTSPAPGLSGRGYRVTLGEQPAGRRVTGLPGGRRRGPGLGAATRPATASGDKGDR